MKNKINFKIEIFVFFISSNIIFSQDRGLDYYNNQQFEAARKYYESIILESHNNPEAQYEEMGMDSDSKAKKVVNFFDEKIVNLKNFKKTYKS